MINKNFKTKVIIIQPNYKSIDISNINKFKNSKEITEIVKDIDYFDDIIINMRGVDYIDSTAIGEFLRVYKTLKNKNIYLYDVSGGILSILYNLSFFTFKNIFLRENLEEIKKEILNKRGKSIE